MPASRVLLIFNEIDPFAIKNTHFSSFLAFQYLKYLVKQTLPLHIATFLTAE